MGGTMIDKKEQIEPVVEQIRENYESLISEVKIFADELKPASPGMYYKLMGIVDNYPSASFYKKLINISQEVKDEMHI
jgi:hypothetical protein